MIRYKEPKPAIGILVFGLILILMIFAGAPIQTAFGMYGVAITELMLLACALIAALIFKWDFKKIFKIHKPKGRQIIGTLVLWFASYLATILVTLIIMLLFPDGLLERSAQINSIFASVPLWISLVIAAVLPAVCEEALHRGFILYSFKNIKSRWVTIMLMGFIFGIFHLDLYRFLPTAVMGFMLTYIMIETQNILFPALFHFVNNAFSVLSSSLASKMTSDLHAAAAQASEMTLASVGIYCIFCAVVPFLLIWGRYLLKPLKDGIPAITSKNSIKAAVISAVMLFVASVCAIVYFVISNLAAFQDLI